VALSVSSVFFFFFFLWAVSTVVSATLLAFLVGRLTGRAPLFSAAAAAAVAALFVGVVETAPPALALALALVAGDLPNQSNQFRRRITFRIRDIREPCAFLPVNPAVFHHRIPASVRKSGGEICGAA
jgi:hypothetical protein